MRLCEFFTFHCPTCEKSRFNDRFSLCRVLLFHFEKNMVFGFVLSFEKMPSPCSTDLRWRIIWLVLGARKPAREVAELLGVTQKTIFNILCGFRRNGNVRPCRIGRPNIMASIARDEAFLLMGYIKRHPGAYLREAVQYLENVCGRELSLSSVRRCLTRRDFTRK